MADQAAYDATGDTPATSNSSAVADPHTNGYSYALCQLPHQHSTPYLPATCYARAVSYASANGHSHPTPRYRYAYSCRRRQLGVVLGQFD